VIGVGFAAVLAAAQDGSEAAFSQLWRDTNPALLRYLRAICPAAGGHRGRHLGQDAAQLGLPVLVRRSSSNLRRGRPGLVYRYDPEASPDGLRGEEGTFSICSFWYLEALTRRIDEARLAFEKMLTYANLGLDAEQISRTGEQQGNFPQAFTHLALISAAVNLDRALG
jgi:hypothetical protein